METSDGLWQTDQYGSHVSVIDDIQCRIVSDDGMYHHLCIDGWPVRMFDSPDAAKDYAGTVSRIRFEITDSDQIRFFRDIREWQTVMDEGKIIGGPH